MYDYSSMHRDNVKPSQELRITLSPLTVIEFSFTIKNNSACFGLNTDFTHNLQDHVLATYEATSLMLKATSPDFNLYIP